MNRFFISFFLLIASFSSSAFNADSVRKVYASNAVNYLLIDDLHSDTLSFRKIDTSANFFQNFNPIYANESDDARIYLGNLGTATKSLLLRESMSWGFDFGRHSYDPYIKKIEDLKFYKTLSPYTNLYYVWNRKKEQLFNFTFSQNLSPRLNYAVNFNRLVSIGDYARIETDHLNYDANVWYTSKNRRYQIFAAFINSSIINMENGGIKNDSIFSVSSNLNSEFEPVYLNNASNKISDRQYYLKQTFAFGPKEEFKIDTFTITRIRPKFRVFHELRYTNRKDEYKETPLDSGVYDFIYLDSVNTHDILEVNHLQTRLGAESYTASKKSKRLNYTTYYLRFDDVKYTNLTFDSVLRGISLFSERNFQLSRNFELRLRLSNGLIGKFDDNRVFMAQLRYYQKNDSVYWSAELHNRNNDPSITSEKYISNHYNWNNNFSNVVNETLKFSYVNSIKRFNVTLSFANIENEVYFDSTMQARQLRNYKYAQILIRKEFVIWKIHLLNHVYVQANTKQEIIRTPLLFSYQSLYFQSNLFKGAMNIRTGFDIRYYTKTKSYNYDPASTQFYLSNTTIGDYPVIDYFITASLKRAVLMLKVDHLNQGLIGNGYHMVNGYPLQDRILKIGLRWAFYD